MAGPGAGPGTGAGHGEGAWQPSPAQPGPVLVTRAGKKGAVRTAGGDDWHCREGDGG